MGRIVLNRWKWAGASAACILAGMLANVQASQAGVEFAAGAQGGFNLSSMFIGFGIVIAVAFALLSVVRRDKAPQGYKLPPVFSSSIPLVGNFIEFAKDPLGFVAKGRKECGPVFTIDMLAEKCTFLIGADAHAAFFEASDEDLDQATVYAFMKPIFGKGIVYDSPIKKRRQQLRALGSCLRPSVLKTYPAIIAQETREYLRTHWKEEGVIDLHKCFAELIINTASATLLGPEIRGEMFDEMSELYEMLDKGLTPLSIFFPNAPTEAHKKRNEARIGISKLFSKILKKRRADPEAGGARNDMIQKLLEFKYSDGTALTDDEIAGMILAALFAGQHTSSITSTWSLLFLLEDQRSNNGKWMNKILDELASLEPTPGAFAAAENVESATIQQEEELYKVVKEAIRLHPPIIMLMRRVVKPITMKDGTYIPVGHRVMVSNAIAQRLPEVFPNPEKFDPSRWDSFNIASLPRYSFIGFGAGLHTCMGETFAFMQVRTILSVILATYEMELTTPFPEPNYTAMVVPPYGPNLVRYKKRTEPFSASRNVQKKEVSIPASVSISKAEESDAKTTFTREEVARHNTKDSLWIIVKNKVYDVTNYLDLHQGGDAAIINWGGKDATDAVYGPQHPSTVPTLLNRYEIGTLTN